MILDMLTYTVSVSQFFRGFMIVNLVFSPLSILLCFYLTIMGASNPNNPGFLRSLGITVGFIYGIPFLVLLWLISFGKMFDFLFWTVPFATPTVTCIGIFISSILFVIAGNIFVDNLFQFKQGNYSISVYALVFIIVYVVILYFFSKISLPWSII